jgi:hypothetical protein
MPQIVRRSPRSVVIGYTLADLDAILQRAGFARCDLAPCTCQRSCSPKRPSRQDAAAAMARVAARLPAEQAARP